MILTGDCRATLATLPPESVNCCVTSPPYWGLRDYGVAGQIGQEPTPEAFVSALVGVFAAVRRVLRDDGTLWLNLGDSYAASTRGAGGIGKQHSNAGSVIGDRSWCIPHGLKPKDLIGIPWRVAFALQADGWWLRSDIIWAKPNPMPESITDRPTKSHEYLFLLAKSERYYYDAAAIAEKGSGRIPGNKRPQRMDASRPDAVSLLKAQQRPQETRNKRDVWTIATEPSGEPHFAAFPEALVEPCILAGCQIGGTVLDPFLGTGTVGRVAERLGRRWIGCELNPAYVDIAARRTAQQGIGL